VNVFNSLDIIEFVGGGMLAVVGFASLIRAVLPGRSGRRAWSIVSGASMFAAMLVVFLPFVARGLPFPALAAIALFASLCNLRMLGVFSRPRSQAR